MGGQLWLSLTPHIMKDHLRVALNCTLTKSLLLKLKIGKRQRHSNCVVCCCCCSDCLLPFSRASSPFGAWKIPRSSSYAIPAYPVPTFWTQESCFCQLFAFCLLELHKTGHECQHCVFSCPGHGCFCFLGDCQMRKRELCNSLKQPTDHLYAGN